MNKHIIIILILFFFQNIQASEIIGVPKVIDGDTIHIKSYKIRLEGIDAPEMRQKCKKSYLQIIFLNFQKDYYCGQISKKKLIQKIGNEPVKCILSGKDRYKRYLGKCLKGKIMIFSEVSGTISAILVSKNEIVDKETDLLIIECMKMLIPVITKSRGKIIKIYVKENDNINEGDKLIDLNYDI